MWGFANIRFWPGRRVRGEARQRFSCV